MSYHMTCFIKSAGLAHFSLNVSQTTLNQTGKVDLFESLEPIKTEILVSITCE